MDATVIISFYNKIEWLKLVLAGFKRQSHKNFEVIISDDGSKAEVVQEIEAFKNSYPFPIRHIWHEDNGWQKNIILNKSVVSAQSGYLIFVDGDCIPHRHFVREHINHKTANTILAGRRVNLPLSVTNKLTENIVEKGYLERLGLIKSFVEQAKGKSSHSENGIYAYFMCLRSYLNKKDRGVLGSNFSIHKHDILQVNGFDERYLAPAVGEDTDLEIRFRNNGGTIKTLKHLAIQYHLFHQTLPRPSINQAILQGNIEKRITFTPFGIKKTNN